MWTNEFNFGDTLTVVMDEEEGHEDVKLFIEDDGVVLAQWDDELDGYNHIQMTHRMWKEIQIAMETSEGIFSLEE